MEFKYIVFAACSLLLLFMLYKEVRRKDTGWLAARLLASIVAVVSLALLIIPLSYRADRTEQTNEVILVTQGTGADSLIRMSKNSLYTTDSLVLKKHKPLSIKYIPDLAYYLKANPGINTISVYGYGLPPAQLNKLKAYRLNFHFPSKHPDGILSCNWNRLLKLTEHLLVQGTYRNTLAKPVKLSLRGLGSTLDSVVLKAGQSSRFSFNTIPANTGKALYELIAWQGNDTLTVEKVPFEVLPLQQMKVLMLASSPDFEYKFLKNWLYENMYSLSVRTAISKDKYSSDYLNMQPNNLVGINLPLLQKFDVLITDEIELSSLSPAEKRAVHTRAEQGMGLILRVNSPKPLSYFSTLFSFYTTDRKERSITPGLSNRMLKPLYADQDLFMKLQDEEQALVKDKSSRILVSSRIVGRGKIIASVIPFTHSWQLSGNEKEYAAFWSELITKAVQPQHDRNSLYTSPAFPLPRRQTAIAIESQGHTVNPLIQTGGVTLAVRQNIEMRFFRDATFWTDKRGWITVGAKNEEMLSFYVYNKDDWKNISHQQTWAYGKLFAKYQHNAAVQPIKVITACQKFISKWIFLGLFLISVTFLWVELRFFHNK